MLGKTQFKYLSKVSGLGREGTGKAERTTVSIIGSSDRKGPNTRWGGGGVGSGMTGHCWQLEMLEARGVSVGEDWRLERGQGLPHRAMTDYLVSRFVTQVWRDSNPENSGRVFSGYGGE